ncbi:hypothetical protein K9L16_03745 [Candidatus Pacearchaeota archaeon]|nr:hypothetical protein [Candidatus Pacearchaeota archaeon]
MEEEFNQSNLTQHFYNLEGNKRDKRILINLLRDFPKGCLFDKEGNSFRGGFGATLEDSRTVVLYPLEDSNLPLNVHNFDEKFKQENPIPGVFELTSKKDSIIKYIIYTKRL